MQRLLRALDRDGFFRSEIDTWPMNAWMVDEPMPLGDEEPSSSGPFARPVRAAGSTIVLLTYLPSERVLEPYPI
jgi:hypothetical protein